jgi:hypothetical protein
MNIARQSGMFASVRDQLLSVAPTLLEFQVEVSNLADGDRNWTSRFINSSSSQPTSTNKQSCGPGFSTFGAGADFLI